MIPASLARLGWNGWSKHHLGRPQDALSRWVGIEVPRQVWANAMRWCAVLDGGKRLRPCSFWRHEAAPQRPIDRIGCDAAQRCDEAALRAACAWN